VTKPPVVITPAPSVVSPGQSQCPAIAIAPVEAPAPACLCGTCSYSTPGITKTNLDETQGTCDYTGETDNDDSKKQRKAEALCLKPPSGSTCSGVSLDVLVSPGAQGGNTCTNAAPIGTPITVSFNNNNSKCPNGWYLERPDGCATQSGVNNWYVTATCVNGGTQVKIHTSCSCEIGLCSTFNGYTIFGYQLFYPADPNSNVNPWIFANGE